MMRSLADQTFSALSAASDTPTTPQVRNASAVSADAGAVDRVADQSAADWYQVATGGDVVAVSSLGYLVFF